MMKRLILFSLFTLFSQHLHSQEYVRMAVDSATWLLGSTSEDSDVVIVLRLEGDTIVDNFTYSKIYHYDLKEYKLSLNSRRLLGLIRDDVDERKVYGGLFGGVQYKFEFYLDGYEQCDWGDINTFNEHLLYDFGLQEGDTLNSCMFLKPEVVASIDLVDIFGYQRRRFFLDDDYPNFMTEGIGTCMGIFKGEACFLTGSDLAYSLFKYCIGSFSNCNILTSTKEEFLQDFLIIYPNPVSDKLIIESSIDFRQLSLMDSQGRIVDTFTNMDFINLRNHPSGLYILKAEDKDGKIYTKRVIKH